MFKRLHICWSKANETTIGFEGTDLEELVPYKDAQGQDLRSELEKNRGEAYKQAYEEHQEVVQQLTHKNRQLKEIIEQMRNNVWEINTMLAMRQ